GIPMELITDQGKEFCNKLSDEMYKLLDMKHGRTSAYHPQCNAQAEVFNKTISRYLTSVVGMNTLDWELYLAPLKFSYNTSFHRTIQTSPYFVTFGQHARQPAFQQGDLQRKYYGESSAAEKFRMLQQTRELAWRNSHHQQELNRQTYDRQAAPHSFKKGQWVLIKEFNFLHKNAKIAQKYAGPYKILELKPHNNILLKLNRGTTLTHANRLKPYYSNTKFQTFQENFEKQGGDLEFEELPTEKFENEFEEQKSENEAKKEKETKQQKRRRGRPRKCKQELTEENWHQIILPNPKIDSADSGSESEAEEESEAEKEKENESESESEGEEEDKPIILVPSILKRIQKDKRIQKLIKEVIKKETDKATRKINLIDGTHPIKKHFEKVYDRTNPSLIKKQFPGWSRMMVINYWCTGDYLDELDDINFTSLSDNPYLPRHLFTAPAQNIQAQPLPNEVDEAEFEDEEFFHDAIQSPPPAVRSQEEAASTSTPTQAQKWNPANIRDGVKHGAFGTSFAMPDLNADEKAFLHHHFYRTRNSEEFRSEVGRSTRINPDGIRNFFGKKKK
ncbi:MAG: hypothetical protein ACOYB0_10755, partial [Polynucleobacter sp.]